MWLLVFLLMGSAFAKDVLIIGDSLTCGPFGGKIAKTLIENQHENVTVFCAVNAVPSDFNSGKLPVAKYDKVTKLPVKYYDCHTCSGSACAPWFNAKIPDEEFLKGDNVCNGADVGTGPSLGDILKKKYDKVVMAFGTNSINFHKKADDT